MATKTIQPTRTARSWNNLLFLMQEPNRQGEMVWNIRLVLGELPPTRYGPFHSKPKALAAFKTIADFLETELWEIANEAGNRASCNANEEF